MFCDLFIALLLSIWFYYSVAFLLLCRYLLDFIALSSFYFLPAIRLFSMFCDLFVAKMLGRAWLLKIMLWSGGAVNLLTRFWPALCYIFDQNLGRNDLASCDWICMVLSSFWRGRWELSNDAKTACIGCLDAELLRLKVLEKNME